MSTSTSIERLRGAIEAWDAATTYKEKDLAWSEFENEAQPDTIRALLDELDALRGLLMRYVEQDEQTGLVENNLYRAARAALNTKEAK